MAKSLTPSQFHNDVSSLFNSVSQSVRVKKSQIFSHTFDIKIATRIQCGEHKNTVLKLFGTFQTLNRCIAMDFLSTAQLSVYFNSGTRHFNILLL